MEGDGMVAVVRGLREAGLAVTLLDGNRQYTLLPNTTTQPQAAPTPQRAGPIINVVNASTQQCPPKFTTENSTEPVSQLSAPQCDRDAQAVDGRYASMYKTMHCNMRSTSPPVQLAEFPPQKPELYPGHGNFIVGGAGSGETCSQVRASSPVNSFRGGMCWPDRGSVCSPRPSRVVDEFAKSLRKYPNSLSPDRSSEVMERLVNYTQNNKAVSRTFRNSPSPTRISEQLSSQNVLESKATFTKGTRSRTYEPDVTIRPKKTEDPPTRDRKKDEHHDRAGRSYDVRCVRDMSKKMREGVKAFMSYPYSHPVCPPTIKENQDYHPLSCDYQNSSNSVNMEIQAAVQMLSKEVATLPRGEISRKTVAVPESPIASAGEDYVEGEFYFVENLDIRTSIKSIQTNFYPSDTTLKPRKSAQTVFSTIDFHSSRNRTIVSRKTKSQEEIKVSKDELKINLLQLINEISDTVSKNTIRDELIKKLFVTDNCERTDQKYDRGKSKHDKCRKFGSGFCSTVCDYVGDYQQLVGKLKHCYGDSKHVLRSEIKPFRLSEYRQLDFVLKDWVSNLNLKSSNIGRYVDRSELLNSVEDRIKELLKNWTKEDFDLKSEIVEVLEEIPIEVNRSYGIKSYLRKLVDVLLKRMRNVIVTQQSGRIRRRSFTRRSRKILTEEDMRDYLRAHLLDFLSECNSRICNDTLDDLENELLDLMMYSIDCIWCGHDDEIIDEMNIILQDLGKMTNKQANCISNIMLQDLQDMLNNCVFNQSYTILNVRNNSGPYMNSTDNTDFSIGSINEEDLDANLDRYTNQLCLQINQWLETLNIPRIQDSGFREVVVNDLAGDIVDRHKYVELNHTGKDSAQDQLEALKYQIFKWINKLVGDENQETISHAENLLQRINSVPVPMLVNPKHRSKEPCCEIVICPNAGQGSPKPYSVTAQGLNHSKPYCGMDICPNKLKNGTSQSGRCYEMKICPNEGQTTSIPRGIHPYPGYLPHTEQTSGGFYGQGPQTANAYRPQQDQSSPNSRGSGRSFGPASPNNPWGSNTFSSGFEPSLAGNHTQTQHGNLSTGRMGTSGTIYGPMVEPNHQLMRDLNPQAISGYLTESSPTRHGGSVPVKKINEDYDEYLKEWVKKIPIAAKTPAEEETAEKARLGVYNEIWKSVTKMKLDPNIFGNQYYCQDVLEEEMERLLKGVPQSPELEAAKPTLKAELLRKTLAMNDLIKSTNAPASFKQQLIDNIENHLPERTPTENEADKANDELDKQNMADYYILYTRYKDEDNVKATVQQKNFLKKLDEFLNKIKNRHNIADMDTSVYANEIINSFDKIPTPNLPAIKDEADDILLAMEVENWISDIPQKFDTAGPLEKRRNRDAIVKKIQEIAMGVSVCDNAFRIPLKAELPRYLEKIQIQEGTNVNYMIDELANRIKNLSTSIRRVSFQDPQSYEEFSKNMPVASSMHEMSDERSFYLIVGGDVKVPGPRRPAWVREHASAPQEESEWLSLEQTQMPLHMRSEYVQVPQRAQSPQCSHPNASNIPRAQSPEVYNPNASYLDEGNISRDAGLNRTWGNDKAAIPQKRQQLSMQESRMPPNMRNRSGRSESMCTQVYNPNESLTTRGYPRQGNFLADTGPMDVNWGQTPVPKEEIQWLSMEETQMPSQMRSGSISPQNMRSSQVYYPNTSEQMTSPRSYPGGAQQVQDQYLPNAQANYSQGPFSPNVQSQFTSYTQGQLPSIAHGQFPCILQGGELCTGPLCCPNPLCISRTQGSPGSAAYPHSDAQSPSPRGPYGPGYSNGQDSPNTPNVPNAAQTSPIPQRFSGSGSSDRYNQSFGPAFGPVPPNIQNTSVPGSQMHPQGPHALRQGQGPQPSNVEGAPCYSVPNNKGQNFGPEQPAYDQVALGVPGGQPYPGAQYLTSPNDDQGPAFDNNGQSFGRRFNQGSLGPGGQMSFQGQNGAQMGQVDQESSCPKPTVSGSPQHAGKVSIYGINEGSGQSYLDAHHNASVRAQVIRHSPTLNQTSQSPGPVSAASQVPDHAPPSFNLQKMSSGGMGVLGISQVPGPSNRSVSVPTGSALSAPCSDSGARAVGTDAIPAIVNSYTEHNTDNRGVQQTTDQNQGVQQPCGIADQNLQVVCIPPLYTGRPKGCSAPDRERERCKCMRRGRKFKPRIKRDPNDGQVEYHPCMSMAQNEPTHNKLGTELEGNPPEEPKNHKTKPLNVNEKEVFNFKSVQTAFSTIDITTTKCKYCEIRSKSQEELTRKTKKQEVIKITDVGIRDLQQEVTEWFEIHSDKIKVKLWGDKMKKLAEKLKKPGGEEKLRSKIEKYLKQAPEQYPEADDDNLEFRKQLPNDIIRKLKQLYLCPTDANFSIYRMEIPKYCSRYKIDNLRKAVQNWTKTLNIKKKDFLGRNVKKDDVFKFVSDKLEPLVLDRPQSDSEYKEALQSSISEIVYELPLALSSHNRDFYLNKVTENLVDNIFMIERKISSTYIQPTTKEIKEFVKDEITFFLEKCRVAISTKRMEYLEAELIALLLDLTDISDIDNYVADDVTKLLKEVVKLPEYKAKYFTNLLLKDYKEFFFRENFFHLKGKSDLGRPDVYSAFQNATHLVDFNSATSFESYRQRLVEEINKWITKLNIPINDKNFMELVVKDLASDIVDRYKYLLLNPNLTGTDVEELEQLKFQIFKWTNRLVGEENTSVLEHAHDLMNEINNIPKPSLQSTSVVQSMSPQNVDKINNYNAKSYIDILTDRIYDWYCELPTDLHTSQDAKHDKVLIKELAGEIEKGLEKKEDGVIDIEVSKWTEKVFNNKLSNNYVQELKHRISNVSFTKDNRAHDLKHEKVIIRSYEDMFDEWIDTVPIAPKKQELFTNNKNEIVHALAVKIHKIKTKINHLPAEVVEKKLQEELSHWMKKLPLHVEVDNQNYRDKYAAKLVKSIQRHNVHDSLENQPKLTNDEHLVNQLETLLLEWLIKFPLYREKSPEQKVHQETTIKRLAYKLNQSIGEKDADEDIIEQIRMLDLKQKEYYVKNMAFQLKSHLQKLEVYKDLCKQREQENKFLVDTIDVWLNGLPLQITDASRFNKQKIDFIKSVKQLASSGTDNAVMKKEILIFARSLPISHKKKYDFRYLNEEVFKLMQSLKIEPIGDVPSQSPPTNTITDHHYNSNEMISNTIKEWTSTLPLKQVHCPRELRSFIDDMSSVVTSLLLNPEHWTAQNDAELHREISKFLRRFPLIYELSTESHIFRMAGELSKTLKNITLFRNENSNVLNNVTVYDVSVRNKDTTADNSIQGIKESDINENLETYTKQLVQQIDEWLDRLNLPESTQEGFRQVAINDLAGDIVDRHKYLELNPNNTGMEEDELEQLKYQIFKWINKLVGEENHETIEHAQELMQKVNSIPVPMLVRPQDKDQAQSRLPSQKMDSSMGQRNNSQHVNSQIRQAGTREPGVSFRNLPTVQQPTSNRMTSNSPSAQQATSSRMSDPNYMSSPNSNPCCTQKPPPPPPPPEESTKDAVYDKYEKIFRDQCNALPIDESTPYNAMLADQARRAIYNGILKTFFNLKSDPLIENDYKFFEFMLEEKLDDYLDVLPQTEELNKIKQSWKVATIEHVIEMLDELHKLSDKPCFRRTVKDKFNRQFALDNEIQYCFLLQQGFLSRMADAYILQTNYKDKDSVKAKIYRNRLMAEVGRLANHLSKVHNAGFRFFDTSKLSRIAMQTLEHVPVPADDVLQEEVERIHIADEIEKWYKELPTQPLTDESDGVFRKRMMEILTKKLNGMHKRLSDEDPNKEHKMKQEMRHFLEKRAELQENEDKNINFMVDQLHFRLKNRWAQLKDPGVFDDFEKAKPFSSTLTHVDNADFLAPIMDAATSTGPAPTVQRAHGGQEYFIQPDKPMQSMGRVVTSHGGAPYSLQGSGHPGSPQKAIIHSLIPNVSKQVPDETKISQGRPNGGYVSLQEAPIPSMQAPTSPRVNLEGSEFGRMQVHITQRSPTRPNLSQQGRQAPIIRQNPQLIQSTGHATPKNARGASQIGSQRVQNINQSLRQVGLVGQTGSQPQRVKQNSASQIQEPGGQTGLLFVPCNQVHSQGQSGEVPRIVGSRGPTRSQGVGTTAQAATGAGGAHFSSEEDVLDAEFHVKCRCLEVYRRMQRSGFR